MTLTKAPNAANEPRAPGDVDKSVRPIVSYDDGRVAYGVAATAKLLGVSRQHVSALIRRGDVRAVKLGRRVLIPAAEIIRLLGIEEGVK